MYVPHFPALQIAWQCRPSVIDLEIDGRQWTYIVLLIRVTSGRVINSLGEWTWWPIASLVILIRRFVEMHRSGVLRDERYITEEERWYW